MTSKNEIRVERSNGNENSDTKNGTGSSIRLNKPMPIGYSYSDNTYYKNTVEEADSNINHDLLCQALLPLAANGTEFRAASSRPMEENDKHIIDLPMTSHSNGTDEKKLHSRRRTPSSRDHSESHIKTKLSNRTQRRRTRPLNMRGTATLAPPKRPKVNLASLEIPIAIALWYLLGVVSISTTKILLRDYEAFGVTSFALTFQQIFIGFGFLRIWIYIKNDHPHPFPYRNILSSTDVLQQNYDDFGYGYLVLSAAFFTLGFFLTNLSFSSADASFVETIKASEPITSAILALLWGLEFLTKEEVWSLVGICVGVVISTFGHSQTSENAATLTQSFLSSGVVMGSNLSFSFRGLYQKLFRSSPNGNPKIIDDLNLQYRIHQVGISILLLPLLAWEAKSLFSRWFTTSHSAAFGGHLWNYIALSILNGFSFTHYNLASSFILSRISVVHHAALNCMRRLFAIVITSLAFGVPLSFLSCVGILTSLGGFLLFTRFKAAKKKARPLSSLLPLCNP
uniref:Sugar phosphate transporter domain-containing protein n=1 Tax=Chaetoceros debilis TaxID=122233 RepID=A0A7S3PYE9_9STRA|mmetsp:Transcript_19581/g.29649  ORF Transcript_19581/g.29649 Transcript_19581/m.29649 type:complete len:511 (+) Transcript_19581:129-1661(+)